MGNHVFGKLSSEVARALSQCTISNELLTFPGSTDSVFVKKVGDELRSAVLACKVPHYKVIGSYVNTGGSLGLTDYVTKNKLVTKSYSELLVVYRDLIYAEGNGYPVPRGNVTVSRDDLMAYRSAYGLSFLMGTGNDVITSENGSIFFESLGVSSQPEGLVRGIEVIGFEKPNASIQMILYRGTGHLSFERVENILFDLSDLVSHSLVPYVPAMQDFDLSFVFTVRLFSEGDKGVVLMYKKEVNESVLQKIIRDFAVEQMQS